MAILREPVCMRLLAIGLCALAFVAIACGGVDESPPLRVFAASSLTDVLGEFAEEYEKTGHEVEFNFAGSSALREQILDGAEADVFISANQAVMQEIVDAGRAASDPVWVAENTLTIAVPTGNPGNVTSLADFADESLTLGFCAPEVPCGALAQSVLADEKVISAADTLEPNVRSLLSKVELGELDAALVYRTDVLASDEVDDVPLADGIGGRTIYLAVALDTADPAAESFVSLMTGPPFDDMFVDAGFGVP